MVQRISVDSASNIDQVYDDYLREHSKTIITAIQNFENKLHHSNVKFGRFTIPTFFKPHFISSKQARLLQTVCASLIHMTDRIVKLYLEERQFRHLFALSREAEELVEINPGYSKTAVITRLDCFLEGGQVRFTEFNCDSPAGMSYSDSLESIWFESEELKDFFKDRHFEKSGRSEKLLHALLSVYEEFGGYEIPQIAIVDWKTVRTRPEFEALKLFFEEKGYKTTICDPRELKYKSGRLYHGNFRVDLVYRRVIFNELLEKIRDVQDFLKAYRDRAVCVVNPLRSKLASSKALLSILTNPAYDHYFSAPENELKRECIPWTRRMSDAENFYGLKKIFLIDFLKDEKETLVIKPAEGYGGKEVSIGLETKDDDWNHTIDKALKNNWVVQEFVNVPIMTVPTVINHKLEMAAKKMNTGCFVFDGVYAGSFSRLSEETVINVSQGGGLVPAVVSEGEINR